MYKTLEEVLHGYSFNVIGVASLLLLLLTVIAMKTRKSPSRVKKMIFLAMVVCIIFPTFFLIFSTFYVNIKSVSKGPVHWHADIEVWACGQELELKDPDKFLSNKIGTATLHEHDDKRIHLEGVVGKEGDASIGKFFDVIGGKLTSQFVVIPSTEGDKSYKNGDMCPDGTMGEVQVFRYKTIDGVYTQEKLPNAAAHSIAPFSGVPEGDCIIVEFGSPKDMTDKLCRSYAVAEEIGKVEKGGN